MFYCMFYFTCDRSLRPICQTTASASLSRMGDVDMHAVPQTLIGYTSGRYSFAVARPLLWNNLPVELRQRDIGLNEFRRLLKMLFVSL